jgi:hypothetical protein
MRDDSIAMLAETKSSSMVGILAKATALQQKTLMEDYDRHQWVALFLANDLILLAPQSSSSAQA